MAKIDAIQKVQTTCKMFRLLEKLNPPNGYVTKFQLVTAVNDLCGFNGLEVVNSLIRTGYLIDNDENDGLWSKTIAA